MSLRVKKYPVNGIEKTEYQDSSFEDREVTFNNMTYHYGPNQVRNFLDDGVGIGFSKVGQNIVQDTIPFGQAQA